MPKGRFTKGVAASRHRIVVNVAPITRMTELNQDTDRKRNSLGITVQWYWRGSAREDRPKYVNKKKTFS